MKRRVTMLGLAAASVVCLAAALPGKAEAAQACYLNEVGATVEVPITVGAVTYGVEDCDGSVNAVFENQLNLANFTYGGLVEEIVTKCRLPNGPYRRIDQDGDPRLDYVVSESTTDNLPTTKSTGNQGAADKGSVKAQLGFDPGFDLVYRLSDNAAGEYTVEDLTGVESQILDTEGFEFVAFLPNSGVHDGVFLCGINMWYDPNGDGNYSDAVHGVKNFAVGFDLNRTVVGWAGGPSPFENQDNVAAACFDTNDGLTVGDQLPGDPVPDKNDPAREKFTGALIGIYKTLPGDSPPPINVTVCSDVPSDYAHYCSQSEPTGSLSACNTESAPAVGVGGVAFSVNAPNDSFSGFTFGTADFGSTSYNGGF